MDQETLINYVVLVVVLGALAVGLLSMLFGYVLELFDALLAWWQRGIAKAIHYRPVEKPRYNMSSGFKTYRRTGSEPVKPIPVRSDTGAERTGSDSENVPVHEPADELDKIAPNSREMNDTELIAWMAVVRKPDGSYRFTANKIYEAVGGTRKDVLNMVAELRATKKSESAPARKAQPGSLRRPKHGW